MITLAKYIRLSLEDGDIDFKTKDESNSITNQRALLDKYIATHDDLKDMTVVEFVDDGKSGTNFERPGFQAMLNEIKAGNIRAVIVKDFSRFGRNYIEVSDYLEQIFPFLGVRFISVSDNFDSINHPYGTAGMIDVGFRQIMHQYYSTSLSQKLHNTKQRLFRDGKFHSSFAFYGYEKSKTEKYKLEIDEEAAAVVRNIFGWCIQGDTTVEIAARLNADHVPTPLKRLQEKHPTKKWKTVSDNYVWTEASVRTILAEERYTGKSIYGRTRVEKIGSRKCVSVPKEEHIVVPDALPAIISQKVYNDAQKKRKHLQVNHPKQSSDHPFIAKVRCGHCGYAMRYHAGKNAYFQCERYRLGVDMDCKDNRVYERDLTELILHSIKVQAAVLYQDSQDTKKKKSTSDLTDKLKAMQIKLKRIPLLIEQSYNKMLEGSITENENMQQYSELKKMEAEYQTEIDRLTEALQVQSMSDAQLTAHLSSLETLMNTENLTRELVDSLVESIHVYKNERIEVRWKFSQFYGTMDEKKTDTETVCIPPVCGKRIWLYYRTAQKDQSDESLKRQRDRLYTHAMEKGWEVVGESHDTGSGSNIDRKGLSEVISAAKAGMMDVLLITNIDRISRDYTVFERYLKRLRENKVRLIATAGTPLYALSGTEFFNMARV